MHRSRLKRRRLQWLLSFLMLGLLPIGCGKTLQEESGSQSNVQSRPDAGLSVSGKPNQQSIDSQQPISLPESEAAKLSDGPEPALDRAFFVDALAGSGISFQHTDGGGERQYILQSVAAGLALFDYDRDGWIDVYFLNGSEVEGHPLEFEPKNQLYRNNGDWTFTDVTEIAGVGDLSYSLGVAVGDYDADGDADLYVNNFGANVFYENLGDGTFRECTQSSQTNCDRFGAGVCFSDYDADGDLDLYVANYVDFQYSNYKARRSGNFEFAAAPQDYDALCDVLFLNNSDGTFKNSSKESGLDALPAPSMGIISLDYDQDGDVDLMVCADNAANLLLQNDGAGRFKEVGLVAGVAHDLNGTENGSMGVDGGDYDRDGRMDLYVTNYQGEQSVLYRNVGGGFFTDATNLSGASAPSLPHVKWGTGLVDLDLDSDLDLFIACGHFIKHIKLLDDRTDVAVPNFVMENLGTGRFKNVSANSGPGLQETFSSKGAAFDDLDNDGDLDIVILNANARPSLLKNELRTERNAVRVELIGRRTNRDGVNAKVRVFVGETVMLGEVFAGRSYQSHYGTELHFGLGANANVDRIEVDWLGGGTDIYKIGESGQRIQLHEGGRVVVYECWPPGRN